MLGTYWGLNEYSPGSHWGPTEVMLGTYWGLNGYSPGSHWGPTEVMLGTYWGPTGDMLEWVTRKGLWFGSVSDDSLVL